jgi:hypothetical protein
MNDICLWKKTLKKFTCDFEGFDKDENAAKNSRVVIKMAKGLILVWMRMTWKRA